MCALCRKRRLPQDSLKGVAAGRQRLGICLIVLRRRGTAANTGIQQYLRTVHQLKLSVGAIVEAIHRVALTGTADSGRDAWSTSRLPGMHADETGWREDGVNGYFWTFSTPTERYFVRRGRDKGVVDEVLGESFDGVLVRTSTPIQPLCSGAGYTCCVTSMNSRRCTMRTRTWSGGLGRCANSMTGHAEAGVQPASGYRVVSPNQLMLETAVTMPTILKRRVGAS